MTALALDTRPANWSQVEAAGHGDMDAFALLYSTYHGRVQQFIHRRTGSRVLAEDLTADVFVRALKRISTVEWRGSDFGAWLMTIARNLVADHYKSGRHRLELICELTARGSSEDKAPTVFDLCVDPTDIEAAFESYLTSVTVLTAVNALNALQREVIVLRFLRNLTVAETAQIMNREEGAIKALTFRAVRTLARLLAGAEL